MQHRRVVSFPPLSVRPVRSWIPPKQKEIESHQPDHPPPPLLPTRGPRRAQTEPLDRSEIQTYTPNSLRLADDTTRLENIFQHHAEAQKWDIAQKKKSLYVDYVHRSTHINLATSGSCQGSLLT